VIDLRSDTVTRPSEGMRDAIARADVGDDVLGDDPTVIALEEAAAAKIGKEAALYVPSGTMANLVSLLTHCGRGDEAIAGSESHILHHEGIGAPALGGVSLRTVRNDDRGRVDPGEVRGAIRPPGAPRTTRVCVETTHNRCGGAAIPANEMRAVADVAHEAGAMLHVDGARIFNAAVALETEARTLVAEADTVSFCFSKGLGAPVGSVLAGPAEFVARARLVRRQVGGAMRQVGIIAAGALYALEHNIERLADDHANARRLAAGLAEIPPIQLDSVETDSNIVFFRAGGIDPGDLRERLAEEGVACSGIGDRLRMLTHLDVSAEDIDEALVRIRRAVESFA
jgi:threonine aldolase